MVSIFTYEIILSSNANKYLVKVINYLEYIYSYLETDRFISKVLIYLFFPFGIFTQLPAICKGCNDTLKNYFFCPTRIEYSLIHLCRHYLMENSYLITI